MYEWLLSIEVTEPTGSGFYSAAFNARPRLTALALSAPGSPGLLRKPACSHYTDNFIPHRALECRSVKTDKAVLMLM